MENFYSFAAGRRSIRKFLKEKVKEEDINYFIECASTSPSGCNAQMWEFIAITDEQKIKKLGEIVKKATLEFYDHEKAKEFLEGRIVASTTFSDAPLVIVAVMGHLSYYDPRVERYFMNEGFSHESMMDFLGMPDLLSMGAAIQNLLLAVHERGYGACWMNDPLIAGNELKRELNIPERKKLISVIPVGVPRYYPRGKKIKPLSEILIRK